VQKITLEKAGSALSCYIARRALMQKAVSVEDVRNEDTEHALA